MKKISTPQFIARPLSGFKRRYGFKLTILAYVVAFCMVGIGSIANRAYEQGRSVSIADVAGLERIKDQMQAWHDEAAAERKKLFPAKKDRQVAYAPIPSKLWGRR